MWVQVHAALCGASWVTGSTRVLGQRAWCPRAAALRQTQNWAVGGKASLAKLEGNFSTWSTCPSPKWTNHHHLYPSSPFLTIPEARWARLSLPTATWPSLWKNLLIKLLLCLHLGLVLSF